MKTLMQQFGLVFSLAGLAAVLGGCAGIDMLDPNFHKFQVVITENGGVLEIISDAQGWEAGDGNPVKKKGYVGFRPKSFGAVELKFDLKPSDPDRCTGDPSTSAEWVITRIALSKSGDKTTQKGSHFDTNQSGWLTKAFPQTDKTAKNGYVLNVNKDEGVTSFVVLNRNNNSGSQWAYYEVTATRCSDGATATTDPAWKNGGTGGTN